MAKYRTKKSERITYIYTDALGQKYVLRPGENGVTEAWIADAHTYDDAVHNAEKRDSYYGLLHYDQSAIDGEVVVHDRQPDLADEDTDPQTIFISKHEAAERSNAILSEWNALSDKQRDLIRKKQQGLTNVEIAESENVTETAIRNRLSKVQKHFKNFLY